MSWELIIILQVVISAVLSLITRKISLKHPDASFSIGLFAFIAIGLLGCVYATLFQGALPHLPPPHMWTLLILEGLTIPAAWLIQYKLVRHFGASNGTVISVAFILFASLAALALLREPFDIWFLSGSLSIMAAVFIVLRIAPDDNHKRTLSPKNAIVLVVVGGLLYAVGMLSEKIVVNDIGAWNYAAYGWIMQAVGASFLLLVFARHELRKLSPSIITSGLTFGALTSVAGMLYIYALSLGSLSHTLILGSSKLALTAVLAAIFLNERNNIQKRILALLLSIIGIWLIIA
ncbi:EamA family transporter [Candidatus Saccharibacteria bacterium]|nr:EamA family transporter [Candidatus Saccharibacteria bacterium]